METRSSVYKEMGEQWTVMDLPLLKQLETYCPVGRSENSFGGRFYLFL